MELVFHKSDQWAYEGLQKLASRSPRWLHQVALYVEDDGG